ncbi:hypothetical protein B2J86_07570 [Acidovorax sp. SRB_14]|uniref:DUF72 domain-containing protein n=1 Tax=Acidovorax sp. SRB_14 TaxID=1962699 RepID=UPI001563EBAE|nr:DUF72 domain-containing protein [Acidovorax sp. SRB_14]NMM80791.1 hypothetical protein [Acidovorax sp. SRB_14]
MNILVGTASWTDKTLLDSGKFYPPEAKSAESRLRYYASQFPVVEVDSSYYAIPSGANAQLWAERTPEHFLFNVKAFRLLTGHQTQPSALHKDLREALPPALRDKKTLYYRDVPEPVLDEIWRRFLEALAPLEHSGKLGAVLFQFAPWLINNRDGEAHLRECAARMGEQQMAVEFRNKTWLDERHRAGTLELERELGVAHVIVDSPEVDTANRVPAVWDITSTRLAILRLHGRNREKWNVKGPAASDRFNYDYSTEDLQELLLEIRLIARRVEMMQIIFNNNYGDQGQRNAAELMALL